MEEHIGSNPAYRCQSECAREHDLGGGRVRLDYGGSAIALSTSRAMGIERSPANTAIPQAIAASGEPLSQRAL